MSIGRFRQRVAVVTGGSRGIGAGICALLAAEGARVYSVSRNAVADAETTGAEVDGRVCAARVDVTDGQAVDAFFKSTAAAEGRLDILVNCAGGSSDGLLLRASPEQVRRTLALNLESAISCARAALPQMLKARYGRIVNIGSVVAEMGNAGQSLYAAAKGGLEAFTRSLAREVGSRGICVNCVAPGFIETEMTAAMSAVQRERALQATAVGRFGTIEDVAYAVAFLCGEGSGYVTGAVLHVNGGMYM